MIAAKRENFHLQIRKDRNEEVLKKQRLVYKEFNSVLNQKFLIDEGGNLQISDLNQVFNYRTEEELQEVLVFFDFITKKLNQDAFEALVEQTPLINFCMRLLSNAQTLNLQTLTYLFEVLQQISSFSLLCQLSLAKGDIIPTLLGLLHSVDLFAHQSSLESFLLLILTFSEEKSSRVPFVQLEPLLKGVNTVCIKLREISLFEMEEEDRTHEEQFYIYFLVLEFVKNLVGKSEYRVDITQHKSLWILMMDLTFKQNLLPKLRNYALATLACASISCAEQMMIHQPDLCMRVLMMIDCHLKCNEKVRVNCAIILLNMFQLSNQQLVDILHEQEVALKLLDFYREEQNVKVLYQETECLTQCLLHCSTAQAYELFNYGLINIFCEKFRFVNEKEDVGCQKQNVQLLSAILRFNQRDNQVLRALKERNIVKLLQNALSTKNEVLTNKVEILLKQLDLLNRDYNK